VTQQDDAAAKAHHTGGTNLWDQECLRTLIPRKPALYYVNCPGNLLGKIGRTRYRGYGVTGGLPERYV
jgi:hypothetical protein